MRTNIDKNYSKLIFDLSKEGRTGANVINENPFEDVLIPAHLKRETAPRLPNVSELDVVRHYTKVSQKNFGIEDGFYPLGSCTMKYNPKIHEKIASNDNFNTIHPLQPVETTQGSLEVIYKLNGLLSDITGMDSYAMTPFAGAHGELAGLMIIKAYHAKNNNLHKTEIIVPDSAHGTNPASATISGFDVIEIKSNSDGTINVENLKAVLSDKTAGLMLTNPNTAGVFEKDILEVSQLVHDVGGLLYYDGANLNSLLGVAKPGNMGFDITHLNLHKTFSTPHGGGGPGSGPVGVVESLREFLPGPVVIKDNNDFYSLSTPKDSIGQIGGYHGNFLVYLKAYAYIRNLGNNLNLIGPYAVLNANYIKSSLSDIYYSPIDVNMHEFVFDGLIDKTKKIRAIDIAKRLLDFGVHAPTVYFPLIFKESLMIEPTEVESLETLDYFINIMKQISTEDLAFLQNAPYTTPVRRLDEGKAARSPILHYNDLITKVR